MYRNLTKLSFAMAAAVSLLALGFLLSASPASAAKPAKFPNYCPDGQVGKGVVNSDGTAGWICADDNDTHLNKAGIEALVGSHTVDTTVPNTDALGALSCGDGQVAKTLSGGGWACADDTDTDTQLDQAGVIDLGFVTGKHTVDTDTLGGLGCTTDQIAIFIGTEWVCSDAPDYGTGPKTVFLTSNTYNADLKSAGGALTGLRGADEICQAAAENGNVPPGTYIAWLSTSTKDAIDRLPDNFAGYMMPRRGVGSTQQGGPHTV